MCLFFVLVAAVVGCYSALHSRMMTFVWEGRKNFYRRLTERYPRFNTGIKVTDALILTIIVCLVWSLAPLAVECQKDAKDDHHRRLGGASQLFVQHECDDHYHNQIASLILNGAEGAVKVLFSRKEELVMTFPVLLITLFLYTSLAATMPGLAIPMGSFIPSMLIGALFGRVGGELMHLTSLKVTSAGIYALVGSAAMLGGFTHMTIAIVVLLVEASNDLSVLSPLMLGIFVAHLVSASINHHAYDEVLILKKGVPYMEADIPHELDVPEITASDLCDALERDQILAPEATVSEVKTALNNARQVDFPIITDGICIGITTRSRLLASLKAVNETHEQPPPKMGRQRSYVIGKKGHVAREFEDLGFDQVTKKFMPTELDHTRKLPISRLMDPAPFTILEDMPAPRLYPIFARGGCNVACVISNKGEFRGLLSRDSLLARTSRELLPEEVKLQLEKALEEQPTLNILAAAADDALPEEDKPSDGSELESTVDSNKRFTQANDERS